MHPHEHLSALCAQFLAAISDSMSAGVFTPAATDFGAGWQSAFLFSALERTQEECRRLQAQLQKAAAASQQEVGSV